MTRKILFIDDEKNVLTAIQRQLRRDYDLVTAVSGKDAIVKLESDGPFAVAVCDMRMPEMDGVTTLGEIHKLSPDTVGLMLTGNADQQTAVDAINQGQIFRFLNKPCPDDTLRNALNSALRQYELITAEKTLLQHTLAGSVKVLMDVLSMIEPDAFGQATQIREWSRKVAKVLKIKGTWDLDMAATLMPLGLVAVPSNIIAKRKTGARLTTVEQDVFDAAPGTARRLIANIPRLGGVADMVYYQSKSFAGEGYPYDEHATGKAIPYGARILKVLGDLAKETHGVAPTPADVLKLEDKADQYDPKVLQAIIDLWGSGSAASDGPKRTRKDVTADLLLAGDQLISDIRLKNGNLLLSSGNSVTDAHIERVKSLRKLSGIIEPITIERVKAG